MVLFTLHIFRNEEDGGGGGGGGTYIVYHFLVMSITRKFLSYIQTCQKASYKVSCVRLAVHFGRFRWNKALYLFFFCVHRTTELLFDITMVANLSNDHHATTALPSPTSYDRHRDLVINHDPTSVVAVVEGVTLIVIFLGALVANLIAMTAILRDKLLRKNLHNWLILNLIVNDLGITITSMSFSIVSVFDHGQFLVNNDIMCLVRI